MTDNAKSEYARLAAEYAQLPHYSARRTTLDRDWQPVVEALRFRANATEEVIAVALFKSLYGEKADPVPEYMKTTHKMARAILAALERSRP